MTKIEINGHIVYEYPSGHREWFKNCLRHRDDGPAIEYYHGTKAWYKNGSLHRINGPALETTDGYKEWYLNGKRYTQEEFVLLQFTNNIPCV